MLLKKHAQKRAPRPLKAARTKWVPGRARWTLEADPNILSAAQGPQALHLRATAPSTSFVATVGGLGCLCELI